MEPIVIPNIRNITISGRIGSGATTLAKELSEIIHWPIIEGGEIVDRFHVETKIPASESNKRPDQIDLSFEENIKRILREEKQKIIQAHLGGFNAQNIDQIFKVLVVVENEKGEDMKEIRVDRLVNRKKILIEEARYEVSEREKNNLEKCRRLYANNDSSWVYWDKKYYDLIINTFSDKSTQSLRILLEHLGISNS